MKRLVMLAVLVGPSFAFAEEPPRFEGNLQRTDQWVKENAGKTFGLLLAVRADTVDAARIKRLQEGWLDVCNEQVYLTAAQRELLLRTIKRLDKVQVYRLELTAKLSPTSSASGRIWRFLDADITKISLDAGNVFTIGRPVVSKPVVLFEKKLATDKSLKTRTLKAQKGAKP